MAEEMNRKDAAQEKLTDRNYVYVRYENDDDDEMDIYDIITLCKKGLLIAKRYIALLLVFFVLGGVVGFVKAKVFKEEKYTSTALLFVEQAHETYKAEVSTLQKSYKRYALDFIHSNQFHDEKDAWSKN